MLHPVHRDARQIDPQAAGRSTTEWNAKVRCRLLGGIEQRCSITETDDHLLAIAGNLDLERPASATVAVREDVRDGVIDGDDQVVDSLWSRPERASGRVHEGADGREVS